MWVFVTNIMEGTVTSAQQINDYAHVIEVTTEKKFS